MALVSFAANMTALADRARELSEALAQNLLTLENTVLYAEEQWAQIIELIEARLCIGGKRNDRPQERR